MIVEGERVCWFYKRQKNNGGLLTGKLLYGIKNDRESYEDLEEN
jgi:hypothetical protein